MSLPNWSQLQYSLDDPETIEEAIIRFVAEHNDDPEAHLGDNRSLQNHKNESIIDHPPGSILADKATMTEFEVRTQFEYINNWSDVGTVTTFDPPGIALYIESGDVETSSLTTNPQVPRNFLHSDFDMVYQVLAQFDYANNNLVASLGFFQTNSITATGFGFIRDGADLYGRSANATESFETSPFTVDMSDDHVYRAYLDAYEQTVFFFIDGVQVGSLAVPENGWESDIGPRMHVSTDGTIDGNLRIAELLYSRGLISPIS